MGSCMYFVSELMKLRPKNLYLNNDQLILIGPLIGWFKINCMLKLYWMKSLGQLCGYVMYYKPGLKH